MNNKKLLGCMMISLASTFILSSCGRESAIPTEKAGQSDLMVSEDADREITSNENPSGFSEETMATSQEGARRRGSKNGSSQSSPKSGSKKTGLSTARNLAEQFLHKASQNAQDGGTLQLYQTMASALGKAKIATPSKGHDFKGCSEEPGVLAFVMSNRPNRIHVCARAQGADPKTLAQILIHETAHVVGIGDECQATDAEVNAMHLSGNKLAFHNGYMQSCGIHG